MTRGRHAALPPAGDLYLIPKSDAAIWTLASSRRVGTMFGFARDADGRMTCPAVNEPVDRIIVRLVCKHPCGALEFLVLGHWLAGVSFHAMATALRPHIGSDP